MTRISSIVAPLLGFGLFCAAGPILAACLESPADTFTCNTNAPNPDSTGIQQNANNNDLTINMLHGSAIEIAGSDAAINTGDGNNRVTLQGAQAIALDDDGIGLGSGDDVVTILNGSFVHCDDNCVATRNGSDRIEVRDSDVLSEDNNGLDGGNGADTIIVRNSTIRSPGSGNNFGIRLDDGDDNVTITNSLVLGNRSGGGSLAIVLGDGDDTLRLETGARLIGAVECHLLSTDDTGLGTIVFAMAVPEAEIPAIEMQLAAADPADGNITINGEFYQWQDCSALVSELTAAHPTPTISNIGLALTAMLLMLLGLGYTRRAQ